MVSPVESLSPSPANSRVVSRRTPELSLVVGLVLGGGTAAFVLFAGVVEFGFAAAVHPAALALVALGYPFAGYAIVHAEDPTNVLPPTPVLVGAGTLAAGLAVVGVVLGRPFFGLFVALCVTLPPAAYHVGYGVSRNPLTPDRTFVVAGLAAAGVLFAGLASGDPLFATVDALLLFVAAGVYRDRRGSARGGPDRLTVVGGAVGVALLVVAYGLFVAASPIPALATALAVLIAANVYYRLTVA